MSAVVVPKPDASVRFILSVDGDDSMEEGFGELRADVRHIQSDATDIKAEVRATNVRLDSERKELATKMEDVRKEVATNIQGVRGELGKKLDDLAGDVAKGQREAATKTEDVRVELTGKIDHVEVRIDGGQKELAAKIDGVKDSLAKAKVWALTLYIGLAASLFYVIARGFKWL
jgi:hypothetical protein